MLLASSRARVRARQHRKRALNFYRQFIRPGDLCFDVGANVGDRTELFLALGARVVAVEPQADCIEALQRRFDQGIELVGAALGPQPGEAELLIASYHTLSSLSPEWVAAVRASGRFEEFVWDEKVSVPMTTLDELIGLCGVPNFCKIDVEGYELEVLHGLSQAIPALSFEFTIELIDSRLEAVDYLARLGMTRFNFSIGESMELALRDWMGAQEMRVYLAAIRRTDIFGDVYAVRA